MTNLDQLPAGSVNRAWARLLEQLLLGGDEVRPRGFTTKEILACTSAIPMAQPIVTLRARKLGYKFLPAEAAWILSGDNRVSSIVPFGKHLRQFSDDGLDFFGAYGPKFVEQRAYVLQSLLADVDTRQAVMTLWRERPRTTKDVPCTVALQWFLRDGRLDCSTYMRSSDAWLGWPYDVFNFSMMSAHLLVSLRYQWQAIHSSECPYRLGNLYLTAGSQHLYKKDWELAQAVLAHLEDWFEEPAPLDLRELELPDQLTRHLWNVANRVPLDLLKLSYLKELYHVGN